MYKNYFQIAVAATGLFLSSNLINVKPAQAISNPFNFDVTIDSGGLNGQTYSGSFSYDDAGIGGTGEEDVSVSDLEFIFDGNTYTDDGTNAQVLLFDGELQGLNFTSNPEFSFVTQSVNFDSNPPYESDFFYTGASVAPDGGGDITYTEVPFGVDSTQGLLLLGGLFMAKKAINRRRLASK